MSLSSLTVTQLRDLMGEYGLSEPKGTGEKGKVIKNDLLNHIKEYEAEHGIVRKGAKKAAASEKQPAKAKSPTAGLKLGDRVLYVEDDKYNFEAIVTGRIASTKVMITPVADVDDTYNTKKEADVFRKNLTIIGGVVADNGAVGANDVKLTIKGSTKTIVLDMKEVDVDQLTNAIVEMLVQSDIKYTKK